MPVKGHGLVGGGAGDGVVRAVHPEVTLGVLVGGVDAGGGKYEEVVPLCIVAQTGGLALPGDHQLHGAVAVAGRVIGVEAVLASAQVGGVDIALRGHAGQHIRLTLHAVGQGVELGGLAVGAQLDDHFRLHRSGHRLRHLGGQGCEAVVLGIKAIGVGNGQVALLLAFRDGHIVGYIPHIAVFQIGNDLQALGGPDAVLVFHPSGGSLVYGNGENRRGDCHGVAGVVLIVDGAVLIGDGGADAVLVQGREGGENLAVALVRGGDGLSLALLILQNGDAARLRVVGQVNVDIALLLVGVGGCHHGRGLGVALDVIDIGLRHGAVVVQVKDGDAVAGEVPELAGTGNANVDSVIEHRGGAGGHGVLIPFGVLKYHGVKINDFARGPIQLGVAHDAALGGEEKPVGIGLIGDVGADVSPDAVVGVHQLTGKPVEDQEAGGLGGVASLPVVGTHQDILLRGIGSGPVETAGSGIGPGGDLALVRPSGVFIRHRQADKVGVSGLAVPEAHIDVSVLVGDRAVGLAAQRIGVDPQGFQGLGVEGLHLAGQGHEDHAVAVGGRDDAKAAGTGHGPLQLHLTSVPIHPLDGAAHNDNQVAVHQDGGIGCGSPAGAPLGGPQQLRILRGIGGSGPRNAQVVLSPEAAPLGIDGLVNGLIDWRLLQGNLNGAGFGQIEAVLLTDVAILGHGVGIVIAGHQGVNAVFWPEPLAEAVLEMHNGVLRCHIKRNGNLSNLVDSDFIGVLIAARIHNLHQNHILAVLQGNHVALAAIVGDGVAVVSGGGLNGDGAHRGGGGVGQGVGTEALMKGDALQGQRRQGGLHPNNLHRIGLEIAFHAYLNGHTVDAGSGIQEIGHPLSAGLAAGDVHRPILSICSRPLCCNGRARRSILGQGGPGIRARDIVRHQHGVRQIPFRESGGQLIPKGIGRRHIREPQIGQISRHSRFRAGHFNPCRCRSIHCILRGGIAIRTQEIIGARGFGQRDAQGGAGIGLAVSHVPHLFPVGVVQRDIHARERLQLVVGRIPALEVYGEIAAWIAAIDVLIKAAEFSLQVEIPVGEQANINGVPIGQQDIVRRGAPARTHKRVHMIAVILQVQVMAPEVVHKEAGGAA